MSDKDMHPGQISPAPETFRSPPSSLISGDVNFLGRAGEIVGLVIKNALLNIVTLGFYRFWARTKVRQYLWEKMEVLDSPLEYTGTGKELFVGFLLIVFVVFLPWGVLNGVLESMGYLQDPEFVPWYNLFAGGLAIYLIGVATYRARRYRLTRTRWRSIRLGQTGSSWIYGLWHFLYTSLQLLLGLVTPWKNLHLWQLKTENTLVGNKSLKFNEDGGNIKSLVAELYLKFTPVWSVLVLSVFTPAIFLVWLISDVSKSDAPLSNEEFGGRVGERFGGFFDTFDGGYILFWVWMLLLVVLLPMLLARYKLHETRLLTSKTSFENLEFTFQANTFRFIILYLGNLLIILLTLGFGQPFAQLRMARFISDNTTIRGTIDLAEIIQGEDDEITGGEGLADAFDMGAV